MSELGQFLEKTRIERNLSKREFAKNIHVSPDTLVRIIEEGEPPTIKTLRSVSGYTGMALITLLRMAFPNEIPKPTAQAQALAQKIDLIPEPRRTWIIELIENAEIRRSDDSSDEDKIGFVEK